MDRSFSIPRLCQRDPLPHPRRREGLLRHRRAELRQRNFITPAAMPYQTRTGWTYDTGDYVAALRKCQALADWPGYEARVATSQACGRRRGRGIVYYVDNTGLFNDRMEIRFDPDVWIVEVEDRAGRHFLDLVA